MSHRLSLSGSKLLYNKTFRVFNQGRYKKITEGACPGKIPFGIESAKIIAA